MLKYARLEVFDDSSRHFWLRAFIFWPRMEFTLMLNFL
jgi:hypothetical protein